MMILVQQKMFSSQWHIAWLGFEVLLKYGSSCSFLNQNHQQKSLRKEGETILVRRTVVVSLLQIEQN
jgi:hypothetical protein